MIDMCIPTSNSILMPTGYVAFLQGLAMQERAGILGSKPASANRRWEISTHTILVGATAVMRPN